MILDNLLADGQAEAGALGLVGEGIADLLEFLEDLGLVGRCDADAGVRDADDQFAALPGAEQVIEPASVNLTAFEMRLMTTWMSRSWSPVMDGQIRVRCRGRA